MAKVLLIEDDEATRTALRIALRFAGHVVTEARDGNEGTERHAGNPGDFDVVVSDLILPGKGGFSVVRELRERWPEVPVVVMSGAVHALQTMQAMPEFAGMEFLAKPFPLEALVEKINATLARRSAGVTG